VEAAVIEGYGGNRRLSPAYAAAPPRRLPGPARPAPPARYPSAGASLQRLLSRWSRWSGKWLRRLLKLVLVLVVIQLGLVVWVYVTVNHQEITSTSFMSVDRDWARNPTPYRPLGRQSGRQLAPAASRELRLQLSQIAYEWVSIDNVSRAALEVLVSREDQQLVTREWMPFDVSEFVDRADSWLNGGRDKDPSGSTVPQQLAKNLFTDGERSAWRKLREADLAMAMSLTTSNRRILEVYANIVEFGPGVYGVCAASWYYFDKPPGRLTAYDVATLVGLMPNPKVNKIDPTHKNVKYARQHLSRYLKDLRQLPKTQLDELLGVQPRPDQPSCAVVPASLTARLQVTRTSSGYPLFADDQSYWPRMTRQYARGTLPPKVRGSLDAGTRARLVRLAPHTPGTPQYQSLQGRRKG
jgi:membrane peptidoglycan carboxypeptidase